MRTRRSNKGKRFRPSDIIPKIDSDDDDYASAGSAENPDDSSDEGFVADPADADAEVEQDEDAEIKSASDIEVSLGRGKPTQTPGESVYQTKRRFRDPRPEAPAGTVQPYPTDPAAKWTRTYIGPVHRWTRLHDLSQYWFGDREDHDDIIYYLISIWENHELLPPKLVAPEQKDRAQNPWMHPGFPVEQEIKFKQCYEKYVANCVRPQVSATVPKMTALRWYLPQSESDLTVLLGPYNNQKEYTLSQGKNIPLGENALPVEENDNTDGQRTGWLLDVGGIVLSMGWAPTTNNMHQLLAMAVVPFSDQAYYETPEEAPTETSKKQGSVQIWRIPADTDAQGLMCLAKSEPTLVSALCFEWGRPLRMLWCPVPLTVEDRVGLLAVLGSDGKIRVIEVKQPPMKGDKGVFEEIQAPLATLEIKDEYSVEATCFAWVNTNRIAVGHSDGSVAVWSIFPCRILQRHPVHSTYIIDIASGYPSHPFIVATIPTGGVATVTDLNRPNMELTYCPNLGITFQSNLMGWCEHLRGYVTIMPSSHPGNNLIAFMAVRVFPQARLLVCVEGQPTCLAVAACNPFTLVGSTDGSLWIVNHFRKTTYYRKKVNKIKLFQHEYRSLSSSEAKADEDEQEGPRGVSRILQGFLPEPNSHPKATRIAKKKMEEREKKNPGKSGKAGKKGKGKTSQKQATDDKTKPADSGDDDDVGGDVTVYDPWTRITAVAWNPNIQFSTWAAAAMGSGLLRIMDLGVDIDLAHGERTEPKRRGRPSRDNASSSEEVEAETDNETSEEEGMFTGGTDDD
ncbi:uncharacterized protein BCR38DRAFT_339632 [Pseudomassariella vexata]|uniref:WD40-repeat-containing domain protein n=1 Tax=Pseudomassariella vexata TaxID=1141098 RepID=A0A1Y2E378_9PEZI|nr:uncharacterized protein BCR38DRAFT_339632 [Pseudomassariella vexata]ORY66011.1 hypothetical protein BCR38DRAFT_339632 [Pseudomassariella vexata]